MYRLCVSVVLCGLYFEFEKQGLLINAEIDIK